MFSPGPSTAVPAQAGVSVLGEAVTGLSGVLAVLSRPQRQETIGEALCSLEMPEVMHSRTNADGSIGKFGLF